MRKARKLGMLTAVLAVTMAVTGALGATKLMSIGVLETAQPEDTPESAVYALSPDGTYAVGYSNGSNGDGTATIQKPVIWTRWAGLVELPNLVDIAAQARGVVVRPNAGMVGVAGNIANRMMYYQAPPDNLTGGTWTINGRGEAGLIGSYNTARLGQDYPDTEGWFIGGDYSGSTKDFVQGIDGPASLDHYNAGFGDCVSHSVCSRKWTAGYDHGNPGGARRALFMNVNNGSVQTVIPGGSGVRSEAFGISPAGTALSGFDAADASNSQAFVWKVGDAAMTLIGTLPFDAQSCAIDVNLIGNDWIAVGSSSYFTTRERAVVWDTTGTWDNTGQPKLLSDLLTAAGVDVSDWSSLTRATTMSADGTAIAGWGVWAADGSTRGFVVVPPGPCPDPFADADRDGDVDQDDFAVIQACFTGAANPDEGYVPVILPGCECFDVHPGLPTPDHDVDSDDVVAFERCASGPGIPADPACDD